MLLRCQDDDIEPLINPDLDPIHHENNSGQIGKAVGSITIDHTNKTNTFETTHFSQWVSRSVGGWNIAFDPVKWTNVIAARLNPVVSFENFPLIPFTGRTVQNLIDNETKFKLAVGFFYTRIKD